MELNFTSQKELFDHVKPALNAKKEELHRLGYPYITINDIWNYLAEKKWKNGKDLALSDIVSDIIHADNRKIEEYLKGKLTKTRRSQYFDNDLI